MWHWIRRWRDWAVNERLPLHRVRSQAQPMHCSYEKAGLTLPHSPVPWNADAVLVEATLRLPPPARRKADYTLRIDGGPPVVAEQLRRGEARDDTHRLSFRIPTPAATCTARLFWKQHLLGETVVPILTADAFLRDLELASPTLFVRLGDQMVASSTFVATQCRGLTATAVVRSKTHLAALADLGLRVEFRSDRTGTVEEVSIPLTSSQLAAREVLASASPRKVPRRLGAWSATWKVGDKVLGVSRAKGISQRTFAASLRVSDTRFVVETRTGSHLSRQAPPHGEAQRVGPAFLIASREAGMAGLCDLRVVAQVAGAVAPPLLQEKTLLITDGPTLFAPGTLDAGELEQLISFELRLGKLLLGLLPLHPVPEATFNSEGGFKPPPAFAWSPLADDELTERLGKLMG